MVKNEESFWKIKKTRDMHDWHKEYVALMHGHVSVEQWEGLLENYMVHTLAT